MEESPATKKKKKEGEMKDATTLFSCPRSTTLRSCSRHSWLPREREKKKKFFTAEGRHQKAEQEYRRKKVSPEVNANVGNICLFDIVAFHALFLQTRGRKEISSTMKAENENEQQ
jgi:hypothetical protein